MAGSFARGTFWNKRGASIDVWRMVKRRFAKITASSQKLPQLCRKRRKGSLRSKRFHASSTRRLLPERKRGRVGRKSLLNRLEKQTLGRDKVASIERRQK